jgi:hypothetical protein
VSPKEKAHAQACAKAFLAAYRLTASVTAAAKAAGFDKAMHYRWLASWPSYAKRFAAAQEHAGNVLEDEAIRRATEGVTEAIYYQGRPVGAIKRYSDGLMQFLLRGFKPAKYGQKTEFTGADGGPIEIIQRLNSARARMIAELDNDATRSPTDPG